jgi:hypothetical protein
VLKDRVEMAGGGLPIAQRWWPPVVLQSYVARHGLTGEQVIATAIEQLISDD